MNDDIVDDNATKLRVAIEENDTVVALSLISSGLMNVRIVNAALIDAAKLGRVEMLSMLLDAGANIDATDISNRTACHAAVQNGRLAALRFLIERGAKLNASLFLTLSRSHVRNAQMVTLLLDTGVRIDKSKHADLLNLLLWTKSVDVLKRLLARKVNVRALRDYSSHSFFHILSLGPCGDDARPLAQAMVELAGVDLNDVEPNGKTPIHYAAMKHNRAAVCLLVEFGADIDRQDSHGRTALHLVSTNSGDGGPCTELLLALGADVRVVNNVRQNACNWAVVAGKRDVLCALLAAGGDLDQRDSNGSTPRDVAVGNDFALPSAADIDAARRRIAAIRLSLVRRRALEVCIGLHSLRLDALQMCEILACSCGVFGALVAFHQWWAIATIVKHFHSNTKQKKNNK
jgi:ankyrin repeat protein